MKINLIITTGFLYGENYIHIMRTMQKFVAQLFTDDQKRCLQLSISEKWASAFS